ncbi:hypothetical protein [Limimaricola cinnabarinus]|nr:hypothetical protein [Limimaricola cinnabarinus]
MNETDQEPLKFYKLENIKPSGDLLADARKILAEAERLERVDWRHARRNRATAISLGTAVPARPEDVHKNHVFGKGLFWDADTGNYRFEYRPQKTCGTVAEPLRIPLNPEYGAFIDAVILQDQDRRYLGDLRAQAIAAQRPLYVNYDGSPCAYGWYSRQWAAITGTGGQIARTVIYDSFASEGEFGLQYAKASTFHKTDAIPEKYRSMKSKEVSYRTAQDLIFANRSDDDYADLI